MGLLESQHRLQREAYHVDPTALDGDERAHYLRWNVLALENELHEALEHVGWKPWANAAVPGEWKDRDRYIKELVDALHFLLNLFLLAGVTSDDELGLLLHLKQQVNLERQRAGYAG